MEKLRKIAFIEIDRCKLIFKPADMPIVEIEGDGFYSQIQRLIEMLSYLEIELLIIETMGMQKMFASAIAENIRNRKMKINVLESRYPLFIEE